MGKDHNTPVMGDAWINETYIEVHHAWLTLPIAIVILSLVLLLATMIQSHQQKLKIWKSESLATLQCLSNDTKSHTGCLASNNAMDERAESLIVKLEIGDDEKGWRIVNSQ